MSIRLRIARAFLALVAGVLVAAGCSSPAITKDLQIKPDAKTGLVLISGTFTGVLTESLNVSCRRVGETNPTKYWGFIIRNPYLEPDFGPKESVSFFAHNNPGGRLAYLELAPGAYEIFYMDGFERGRRISAIKPFSIPFEVSAGRVVYMGNIHFHFDGKSFNMIVLDKRERDLELLRTKAPLILPEQIEVRIASIAKKP